MLGARKKEKGGEKGGGENGGGGGKWYSVNLRETRRPLPWSCRPIAAGGRKKREKGGMGRGPVVAGDAPPLSGDRRLTANRGPRWKEEGGRKKGRGEGGGHDLLEPLFNGFVQSLRGKKKRGGGVGTPVYFTRGKRGKKGEKRKGGAGLGN